MKMLARDTAASDETALTRADQLFAALDGQVIARGSDTWVLRILGVHPTTAGSWLQFRLYGSRLIDAFLAVESDSPRAALDAIRCRLEGHQPALAGLPH
jgi:hypothetical protein